MTIEPPRGKVLLVGLEVPERQAVEPSLTGGSTSVILHAGTTGEAFAGLEAAGVELVVVGAAPGVDEAAVLAESLRRRPLARRVRILRGAEPPMSGVVDVVAADVAASLPGLVRELLEPEELRIEGRDEVLGLVLEVSLVPMFTCDERGIIIATNPRLDDLFGYPGGELAGASIDLLIPQPTRGHHAAHLSQFFADPRPRRMAGRRVRGLSRAGEVMPLEVSLLPVRVATGARVMVSVLDLRGRLEVDERMLRAQRLESVGLMIGGCVHDLRNMLFTLRIGVDALASEPKPGDAGMLVTAVDGIEALSSDMMRLLDGRETPTVAVDLNAVVDHMEPMLQRLTGPRVRLLCVLSAAPCVVRAVPVQIEQILINLVANARDAMAEAGGQIIVSTWTGVSPDHFVLRVEDDGPGMPADVSARAFDAFFTTKEAGHGTGLGLAVCRAVAERLGGSITLETAPGEGCRFDVALPTTAPLRSSDAA